MRIEDLPRELLYEILLRTDGKTLIVNCSRVCRGWWTVVTDVGFWRAKCRRDRVVFADKNAYETFTSISRTYMRRPYGRNLIANPSGEEGMRHWKVLANGGDGFTVERPPLCVAADPSFPVCFATSFDSDIKTQVVDLVGEGCDPVVLDQLRPTITVSEWHAARRDCASTHGLVVRLQRSRRAGYVPQSDFQHDAERATDRTFEKFTCVEQWQDGQWTQSSHSFRDYPQGIRFVVFYSIGIDNQFWAGHYGPKMAGSSVIVHFD